MPAIEPLSLPVFLVLGLLINIPSIGILIYLAAFLKHEYSRLGYAKIVSNKMIKIIVGLSVTVSFSNLLWYFGSTVAWYLDTPGYIKAKHPADVVCGALLILHWVLHLYGLSVRTGNSANVLLPTWFTNHANKALILFGLSGFIIFLMQFLWSVDVLDSQTPSAPAAIVTNFAGTIYTVVVLVVDGIYSYFFGKYVRSTKESLGERYTNFTAIVARYGFRISIVAFVALLINTIAVGLAIGTIARLFAQCLSRVVTVIVPIFWIQMKWGVDDEVDSSASKAQSGKGTTAGNNKKTGELVV